VIHSVLMMNIPGDTYINQYPILPYVCTDGTIPTSHVNCQTP